MTSSRSPSSPAERYLTAWHSRHPDATHVFADMRDAGGRTSYQRLASIVPAGCTVLDLACGVLRSYIVRSIYGLDAISDRDGASLLSDLVLPDVVPWTVPIVQIHARVPEGS